MIALQKSRDLLIRILKNEGIACKSAYFFPTCMYECFQAIDIEKYETSHPISYFGIYGYFLSTK